MIADWRIPASCDTHGPTTILAAVSRYPLPRWSLTRMRPELAGCPILSRSLRKVKHWVGEAGVVGTGLNGGGADFGVATSYP